MFDLTDGPTIACAQCGREFRTDRTSGCPGCGTKKAGTCAVCAVAIYTGAKTCFEHSEASTVERVPAYAGDGGYFVAAASMGPRRGHHDDGAVLTSVPQRRRGRGRRR